MGFTTLIVAFIFIYFNFHLNNLNVLPDLLGYILLYYGVVSIMKNLDSKYFVKAKDASKLLIVLSILDTIIKHSTVLNNVINDLNTVLGKLFSAVFLITMMTLFIYSLYNLCKGIEEEAIKIELHQLAEKARRVFQITLIFEIVSSAVVLISYFVLGQGEVRFNLVGSGVVILFILIAISVFYVFFKMTALLRDAKKAFK